jgi:hypothetical protein
LIELGQKLSGLSCKISISISYSSINNRNLNLGNRNLGSGFNLLSNLLGLYNLLNGNINNGSLNSG